MYCRKCKIEKPAGNIYCDICGSNLSVSGPMPNFPFRTTIHLHSSKEVMYEKGEEIGLKGEALDIFMYVLYELGVVIDVNEDGTYKIIELKE